MKWYKKKELVMKLYKVGFSRASDRFIIANDVNEALLARREMFGNVVLRGWQELIANEIDWAYIRTEKGEVLQATFNIANIKPHIIN